MVSARPRSTHHDDKIILVHALVQKENYPLHIVYCDVNYQGTLTLLPDIINNEPCKAFESDDDKFVPSSFFGIAQDTGDRPLFKTCGVRFNSDMIFSIAPCNHDGKISSIRWRRSSATINCPSLSAE